MKNRIRSWGNVVLGVVLATWGTAPAEAQDVLFAVRTDRLFRIDTATVEGVEIGAGSFGQVGGLAFTPDGTLYGVVAGSNLLIQIDPGTAQSAIVGPLGVPIAVHGGLACDPTSNQLYAVSSMGSGISSYLVAVSAETGLATPVADTASVALVGLACDAQGQLFGIDGAPSREELVWIDKASGELVSMLQGGLKPFPATGALDMGPSGRLWTIHAAGGSYELVEIDPVSGHPTSHGLIQGVHGSGAMNGLASVPAPPASGLQVFPPSPGATGTTNVVMVTGAEPGASVALVFGYYPGDSRLPRCRTELGITMPFKLGMQDASEDGVAEFRVRVRPGIEGIGILLQAVDFSSCDTSDVISVTF